MKASKEEIELHSLILAKNDLAFAMLCDNYLEVVIQALKDYNAGIDNTDSSLIPETVIDSFYSYNRTPRKFNCEKQSLIKFLIMDAEADLKNAWAKRKRLNSKLTHIEFGNENESGSDTPEVQLINQEAEDLLREKLGELFEDKADIELANLILSNEKETAVYADILNITHLEFEERQQVVKRHKDRIKKVLARKLKGKHY